MERLEIFFFLSLLWSLSLSLSRLHHQFCSWDFELSDSSLDWIRSGLRKNEICCTLMMLMMMLMMKRRRTIRWWLWSNFHRLQFKAQTYIGSLREWNNRNQILSVQPQTRNQKTKKRDGKESKEKKIKFNDDEWPQMFEWHPW